MEYRHIDELPSKERNDILSHANRIPAGWDFRSYDCVKVPTLRTTSWETPSDAATEPFVYDCMVFEVHRVRNPNGEMGSALVANGNVIVDWRPFSSKRPFV